jgi:O-antigen/teichoic acid export membrane protein
MSGIARGALVVATGSAVAALAAFASRLLMARALAPAELGLVTLGTALVSAAGGIAACGTNASAAMVVAAWRARDEPARAHAAARGALRLALAGGACAAFALTLGAPLWARLFGRPELATILHRLGPAAWAIAAGTAVLGISRGFDDVAGRALLRDAGGGALRLAGVAWGAATPSPDLGLVAGRIAIGWAAGSVAGELGFALWARARGFWSGGGRGSIDLAEQRPYALLSTLVQTAQWSDVLLLGALAPTAAVGVYGVARGVVRVLEIAAESAGHRFLPTVSAAAAQGGAAAIGPHYRRTRALVAALVWPAGAVLLVAPGPLLGRLFGPAYAAAATPTRLLVSGLLVSVLAGYNDKALLALEGASSAWRGLAAGVLAGSAATVLTAPRWGAAGAGLGFLLAQSVQNVLWSRAAARRGVALQSGLAKLLVLAATPVALAVALSAGAADLRRAAIVAAAASLGALLLVFFEVRPRR